jgi:hypothetical protein
MDTKKYTAVAMAEETAATLKHDSASEFEQMAQMKAKIVALQHTNATKLKTKVDLIRNKADSQPRTLASALNGSISKIANMQRTHAMAVVEKIDKLMEAATSHNQRAHDGDDGDQIRRRLEKAIVLVKEFRKLQSEVMALAQEPMAWASGDLFRKVKAKVDLISKIADLQPTNAKANRAVESAPARSTTRVETVEDEDGAAKLAAAAAQLATAAAQLATAAAAADKVFGKMKWSCAVAGLFFAVLTAANVTSALYETGVVSGDVLGSGVRSMPQSMEARLDSPMGSQHYYDVELVPYCAAPHTVFRPCPKGAWCAGGVLEHCNRDSRHFEVSAAGDQCVLTAASNAAIQEFEQKLIEWTVQDGCTRDMCAYTAKRMREDGAKMRPLFYYTQLVGEFEDTDWDMNLLEVANAARFAATGKHVFFTMRENDNHLIGLHTDQDVPLPFSCLFFGILHLVAAFPMSVWLIFRAVVAWLFEVVTDLFFTCPH